MVAIERERQIKANPVLTPEGLINQLLLAEDPLSILENIGQGGFYFLPHEEAKRLYCEGETEELICYCLPTLKNVLEHYDFFGIERKELFEGGFWAALQGIKVWNPEKKLESGKPDYLRGFVGREIKRALERLIVRAYGLWGLHDFPVVRLYQHCWLEFIEENDRFPTLEEISELVRLKNTDGLSIERQLKNGKKINKVNLIYWATRIVPLEEIRGKAVDPEENLFRDALSEEIANLLEGINPRHAEVLRLRFGLVDGMERTLKEVAGKFGISTREGVRQIEAKALRSLRNPLRSGRLKEFLE